jgi:hypothetical protein
MSRFCRWWRQDRIRVSPRDGALLRLAPAAIIIVRGARFQVAARRVVSLASGPAVVYDCASEHGRCQLRVEPAEEGPRVVLLGAEADIPLREDDIEIFPARG